MRWAAPAVACPGRSVPAGQGAAQRLSTLWRVRFEKSRRLSPVPGAPLRRTLRSCRSSSHAGVSRRQWGANHPGHARVTAPRPGGRLLQTPVGNQPGLPYLRACSTGAAGWPRLLCNLGLQEALLGGTPCVASVADRECVRDSPRAPTTTEHGLQRLMPLVDPGCRSNRGVMNQQIYSTRSE